MTNAAAPPVELDVGLELGEGGVANFSSPPVMVALTRSAETSVMVVLISVVAVELVWPFLAL